MNHPIISAIKFSGHESSWKTGLEFMKNKSELGLNHFDLNQLESMPINLHKTSKLYWLESVIYYLSDGFNKIINPRDYALYCGMSLIKLDEALKQTQDFVKNTYMDGKISLGKFSLVKINALLPPDSLDELYETGKLTVQLKNQYGVNSEKEWLLNYWGSLSNSHNTHLINDRLYLTHNGAFPNDLVAKFAARFGLTLAIKSIDVNCGRIREYNYIHGVLSNASIVDAQPLDLCSIEHSKANLSVYEAVGLKKEMHKELSVKNFFSNLFGYPKQKLKPVCVFN